MKLVGLLLGLLALGMLTSNYISEGSAGGGSADNTLRKAKEDAKRIEDDWAKRAAAPAPGEAAAGEAPRTDVPEANGVRVPTIPVIAPPAEPPNP